MSKQTLFLMTASAFALSACLGSSDSDGPSAPPPLSGSPVPVTEGMPTEGSAAYVGAVNFRGDGSADFPGQMSMRANFNAEGGTVTDGRLTLSGATGALAQREAVAISGTEFSGMALDGTLGFGSLSLTSGGDTAVLVDGTFGGENAAQVELGFGGSIRASDDLRPQTVNASGGARGTLLRQP